MKFSWMKYGILHAAFALRYLPGDEIKAFRADLHYIGRNISNFAFDFAEGPEWVESWEDRGPNNDLLYRVDYSIAYRANIDKCLDAIHKLIEDYGLEEKQFKIWLELDGTLEKRPFGFIFDNDDDDDKIPF